VRPLHPAGASSSSSTESPSPGSGPSNLQPSSSVAPMQPVVVARLGHQGGRHPFMAQWCPQSYVPKRGERWKLTTFNSTIEKLRSEKRSVFSHAWAGQRCIMPASGWYEWPEPKLPHRADQGLAHVSARVREADRDPVARERRDDPTRIRSIGDTCAGPAQGLKQKICINSTPFVSP
jgi:putative SOS response-associated peptidase YedK